MRFPNFATFFDEDHTHVRRTTGCDHAFTASRVAEAFVLCDQTVLFIKIMIYMYRKSLNVVVEHAFYVVTDKCLSMDDVFGIKLSNIKRAGQTGPVWMFELCVGGEG